MSNIELIIEERAANIGNFLVGRLLPFRQKRSVGPFVFIDHMGPVQLNERENLDVLPHPHIGLSTLTYLFEGAILHRDTIGNEVEIQPGAVNWMTAGRGVVHSERTPEYLRHSEKSLHGLQIWVALPKELEETDPSFTHIAADEIPAWQQTGVSIKLIAGEVLGRKSPVPVYSPLYFIEFKCSTPQTINLLDELFGESALYIMEGAVYAEGNRFGPKQILIAKDAKLCTFDMEAGTTVYIFGGEPFPEERYIDWNFVSSSKDRLKQAREDWIHQRFQLPSGEREFVPYPVRNR
ncbi:MAG TPA: pirin family protein [Saprospiraceae bacterium]|nr:pirin family protein [Saprospiraceae bacterium]